MDDAQLVSARRVHVGTTKGRSGIADYTRVFQDKVLGPEGYVLANPEDIIRLAGRFAPDTRFHVQLGIFQHRERVAAARLLKTGYRLIDATIHDPPYATFPYFSFKSPLLMRLSRGFDRYLSSFGFQRRFLERLDRAFVLSRIGREWLQRVAPGARVEVMPHIIDEQQIWALPAELPPAMLYFGFIGPGKGLDYVLQLHEAVRQRRPGTALHVVGQANGLSARQYLEELRTRYHDGVTYHGYVADDDLDALFYQAAHVILPYAPYPYVMPASGSAIHGLKRARIVWTTNVNAMGELIEDGVSGCMLTLDLACDADRMAALMDDVVALRSISNGGREVAMGMAVHPYRRHFS